MIQVLSILVQDQCRCSEEKGGSPRQGSWRARRNEPWDTLKALPIKGRQNMGADGMKAGWVGKEGDRNGSQAREHS